MGNRLGLQLLNNDWAGPALISLSAVVVISILQPSFLSTFNILVLLSAIAVNMVIALGQLVIIGIGQMNLALGTLGGLVGVCFVGAIEVWGLPTPLAALLGFGIGALAGMANGYIIARTGISAFIITLASLQIFKGINLGITKAEPFYGVPDIVKQFGNTAVFGPIPWLVVPMLIAAFGLWYLFRRLRIGRYILAMGGNRQAAELSGIDTVGTVVSICGPVSVRPVSDRLAELPLPSLTVALLRLIAVAASDAVFWPAPTV